ncbi:MAG: hypothetical protein ABL867_00245 [Rickettsiales bacterium]
MERTVKLTTYGPNHGLTLDIGTYHFENGVCEIPEKDASAAASILCRYHDVCFEHELEGKLAEYKAIADQNAQAATSTPIPEPATPAPAIESTAAPESTAEAAPAANQDEPELFSAPEPVPTPEEQAPVSEPVADPAPQAEPEKEPATDAPEPAAQPKPQGNKRQQKQS